MSSIYLDYAATSLKHFDIIEKNMAVLKELYANPNSSHSMGKKSARLLKEARENIASSLNVAPSEIIFTSGGTESNNTVFNHILENYSKGEIIISAIEHSSIKSNAEYLKNKGFNIIEIGITKDGIVDLEQLEKSITENTILISVMLANNETGVIQPLEKISEIIKGKNILFHSDIVQAYGKVNIDVKKYNFDFVSVSGHKIGTLNNFGFLYAKEGSVTPLIRGGGQENGLRSGTSDVLGAMVLADCYKETISNINKVADIKKYFIEKLTQHNVKFEINGGERVLPNIINVYFENIEAQRLITFLDVNDIYISGGAACGSGNLKGSKIIATIYDENRANHSVRISFGFLTTKEMIEQCVDKISTLEKRILERK